MESPGIPNTKAGIKAPDIAALFAEAALATPSSDPLPYSSGCFENFFEIPYVIHEAISPPAPGKIPIPVPTKLDLNICNHHFLMFAKIPEKIFVVCSTTFSMLTSF